LFDLKYFSYLLTSPYSTEIFLYKGQGPGSRRDRYF